MQTLLWAAGGTGFPFLMTALGRCGCLLFQREDQQQYSAHFSRLCRRGDDCRVGVEPFDSGH